MPEPVSYHFCMRLAGLTFIAFSALIGATTAPTTFPAGQNHVDGNILRDARNRPILLFRRER